MGRCKECEEQARLLGMSGEREADLKGRIAELERALFFCNGILGDILTEFGRPRIGYPPSVLYAIREAKQVRAEIKTVLGRK